MSLSALVWLAPVAARGAEQPWRLTWRAPPECPTARQVEQRVEALLGGAATGPRLDVTASVKREKDGWRLQFLARRAAVRQRRSLYHRDCATLGEAAALLVALAVDPVGTTIDPRLASLLRGPAEPAPPRREPPPVLPASPEARVRDPSIAGSAESALAAAPELPAPPAPEPMIPPPPPAESTLAAASELPAPPAPEPMLPPPPAEDALAAPPELPAPPAPPPALPAASEPTAPLARRRSVVSWLALRLAGGATIGVTPATSGGLAAAASLGLGRRARVELTANYSAPTRAELPGAAGAGADVSLTTGGLRGCLAPGRGIVEFPLCLGVELGSMRATGVGVQDASSPRSLWSGLSSSVALAVVPAPRLALWLACEGLLAFNRPRFLIENGGEVWRGGRGGLRVTLGIEVRFRAKNSRRP